MKYLLSFLLLIALKTISAQGVAINNDGSAADNSALIDMKSTTKGMLAPRMTTAQRMAIAAPAMGLLVFDITTNTFWHHNGVTWAELTNYWYRSASDISNINPGNVGIGTLNPSNYGHGGTNKILEIFNIDVTPNAQSQLILSNNGSVGSMGGITWASNVLTTPEKRTGFIGNEHEASSTIAAANTALTFFTNKAGVLSEKVRISKDGNVGIGTNAPNALLHLNSAINSLRIEGPTTIGSGGAAISVGGYGSLVIDKPGFVGGRLIVKEDGNVGIGNGYPTEKLDVSGKIRIVDGSQGVNKVLTSDANGVGTWVTNTGVTPAVFGSFGAGVNLDNTGNFYTTCSITLPVGKWIINSTFLLTPSAATPLAAGQGVWVRTYLTDGAAISTGTANIIPGSSSLISGALNFPSKFAMINGQVMVNNNTGAPKTYHVWASMELMQLTPASFKLGGFNSNFWGENQITAIPMN